MLRFDFLNIVSSDSDGRFALLGCRTPTFVPALHGVPCCNGDLRRNGLLSLPSIAVIFPFAV